MLTRSRSRLFASGGVLSALALLGLWPAAGAFRQTGSSDALPQEAAVGQTRPVHGLTGHYYTGAPAWGSYELDDYWLPKPLVPPAVVRVDPQIAFGRGRGFVKEDGAQTTWYTPVSESTPENATMVIWTGYIRFPEAGTYYLTTASYNASAIYLNEARVALNGTWGGAIPSAAFSYDDPGVDESYDAHANAYTVPIPVEDARVFPIEIRYVMHNATRRTGFGIDLYWVTPSSPRGSDGKPVAQLVPSAALYVEAPGPVPEPSVSAAHSTLSSDFLYYPIEADSFATLTVRVADATGRPLEGKRVHVIALRDRDEPGVLEQLAEPTNEDGIATARYEVPTEEPFAHHVKFSALVLDDMVDVGQVAEISVAKSTGLAMWIVPTAGLSFMPYAFAPYYDASFLVGPKPLKVGRRTAITVPVFNRQDVPYEIHIRALTKERNIGLPITEWNAIGRSESVVLRPGETEELAVEWTPDRELAHVCFMVIVWGKPLDRRAARGAWDGWRRVIPGPKPLWAQDEGDKALESRQQNVGPVSEKYVIKDDWLREKIYEDLVLNDPESLSDDELFGETVLYAIDDMVTKHFNRAMNTEDDAEYIDALETILDHYRVKRLIETLREPVDYNPRSQSLHGDAPPNRLGALFATNLFAAAEPSQSSRPSYRELAAVSADSGRAHLRAMRISMERLVAARAAGDHEWVARQWTVVRQSAREFVGAADREAAALESKARSIPEITAAERSRLKEDRETVIGRLRREGLTVEELERFRSVGFSDDEAREIVELVSKPGELPNVLSEREHLGQEAAFIRQMAAWMEEIAAMPQPPGGGTNEPLASTFTIGNPLDREATVDLIIHRTSIAPDWRLAIVNADPDTSATGVATIREVEAGRHYQVRLPAGEQIRGASIVHPAGAVGENTRVEWAVEGRIGSELIGGFVQVMNMPADPTAAEGPGTIVPPKFGWRTLALGSAMVVVVIGLIGWVFLRRRTEA